MSDASQNTPVDTDLPGVAQAPNHIILATDFSAGCDRAQARAVQLAVKWNARLTAVHALSDISPTDDASLRDSYRAAAIRNSDLLREELASTKELRSSVVVEEGPAEAVVLAVAARERVGLIVTGISRTGPPGQMLVGRTVTGLARTSPLPLLVVKKKVLNTNARVAVATDLSNSSKPALMVALGWFSFKHLALFHAVDPPYRSWVDDAKEYDSRFEAAAEERCREFVREVAGAEAVSRFDVIARRGDAVSGLEILTNETEIDLVIAGTRGRTGLMHALLGSVASRILNQVSSDVLVVPSLPG